MEECITENYEPRFKIGDGGFSKVFYANHKASGQKVAIKMISKYNHNEDGKQMERIRHEIEILKTAKHPFISELYEVIETDNFAYIIMEYLQNGTLLNCINENGPFSEEDASTIFAQLNIVLQYLQTTMKVVHRDIKAENIIFDTHYNIRLIDFGLAVQDQSIMKTQCGSPSYASPEMIMGKPYAISSDIWSCGVVLYVMVVGHLPFEDTNMARLAQKIIYKEVEFPSNLSDQVVDLLKRMLAKVPEERISLDEIYNHPWVKEKMQYVKNKIQNFKYDEIAIFNLIPKIKPEDVYKSLNSSKVDQNTISYNIARRDYMSNNIASMNEKLGDNNKSKSYQEVIALPRLLPNEHFAKSHAKRRSLPSNHNSINMAQCFMHRKVPSVLIKNI